ncbi:DUF1707 SHOCT-like domain-containing protein [Micromonospora narathiwatensis]|uniref:DUF1707 domain-containing protein n=1 Tax=Micromonospora narathiwatensis TaxID=299146 RepID=A0A1A8ZU34_9ACTN|nr:DUF1707 domain-containing protein [Micromonospora narathiwatensis]SBT47421.1 protein of unknown function (DUF1707) [Micromonospora narathiwatensis]
MNLGWSDDGQHGLRATNDDRAAVVRILDIGRDEGRLDSVEHARRVDAVQAAKTRGELVALTLDLPDRRGEHWWFDPARVRGDDRERAVRWLAEGAAQGRLTAAEVERRSAALPGVGTYAELRALLRGLPGWPGTDDNDLLAGTADRDAALARLTEAVVDGRVEPAEHPGLEADIGQARRLRDLRALLADLAARASDQQRHDAAAELAAAHHDGRLDGTEHANRTARTQHVAMTADLAQLTGDLHGDARRLSQAERDDVARRLKRALDEGRLDLPEYESRLRTAYAAGSIADTAPLFADLVDPPRPARRGPLDRAFDRLLFNSALLPAPTRWWQRLFPKPAWKILTVGALLTCCLGVTWHGGVLFLGVPLLVFLIFVYEEMFYGGSDNAEKRQQAVFDELGSALRRYDPSIRAARVSKFAVNVSEVTVAVRFDNDRDTVPPLIIDEAVRLFWLSRLYPLKTINIYSSCHTEPYLRGRWTVQLDRAVSERLRRRYGPRPYGPLPPPAT